MKRIRVNLDKINEFDLKLAQNPQVSEFLEEIIPLPLEERAVRLTSLQNKIGQGEASLFEERVLSRLLDKRTAEWIRVIQKNLPVIEKELEKRLPPPSSASAPAPAPAPNIPKLPASTQTDEYPSEILEFLATQKPPTIPPTNHKSSLSVQGNQDEVSTSRVFSGKDIVLVCVLIGFLLGGFWRVFTSEDTPPPLTTFDTQTQEDSVISEAQQHLQAQFDEAVHEVRFGTFEQGKRQLLAFLETAPERSFHEHAYLLLADTYRQRQNNPDEALTYYQTFIEKFPDSSSIGLVQLKMGFAYEDMKDNANAEAMYRILIRQQGEKSRLGQLASQRLSTLQHRSEK